MEIALYARVSTSRQQQAQTIDQQLDLCVPMSHSSPTGIWPTSTFIAMMGSVVPSSIVPVWIACVTAPPLRPLSCS
jgi:hypothetical protein